MATLARMQHNQRVTFQQDSSDEEDNNAPGPNNPDVRYPNDDDGLDAEEAEQERLMSERYGEAGEAPSGGATKRTADKSDQDIAAELAGEARKIKKPRPTLQPANLIGSNGFIRIKSEFNDQVKYRGIDKAKLAKKGKKLSKEQLKRAELNAAAAYSRDLIAAHRNFCRDLFPSMAFEDTLGRIESLSSKKEVKDYVNIMREDVRRQNLIKIYGAEKTERMLSELESNGFPTEGGYSNDAMNGMHGGGSGGPALANPCGSRATASAEEEEDDDQQPPPPPSPVRDYTGVTRGSQRNNNPYAKPTPSKDVSADDEEEEEVEATFDEEPVAGADAGSEDTPEVPTATAEQDKLIGSVGEENGDQEEEEEEEENELELELAGKPANDEPPAADKEAQDDEPMHGVSKDMDIDEPEEEEAASGDDIADIASKGNEAKSAEDTPIEEKNEPDEKDEEEELVFDATQPSQEEFGSPPEPLGQATPTPEDTEDTTFTPEPSQEEGDDTQEINTEPESEAFGMVKDMEEDTPTQHAGEENENENDDEQLIVDATEVEDGGELTAETLTLVPTMTAADANDDDGGEGVSQMSLEY